MSLYTLAGLLIPRRNK